MPKIPCFVDIGILFIVQAPMVAPLENIIFPVGIIQALELFNPSFVI